MAESELRKEKNTAIADVLLLQQQLRQLNNFDELGYFLTNETMKVVKYRTAIFWFEGLTGGRLESVSGIPFPTRDAPFSHWIGQVCDELSKQGLTKPQAIDIASHSPAVVDNWEDFLPANAIWVPLISPSGKKQGALLFARDSDWSAEEHGLLEYWAGAASHAVEALLNRKISIFEKYAKYKNAIIAGVVLFLFAMLWVPVSMTVLAPAEVIPKEPFVVRAPVDAVIRKIHVAPNQNVVKGQLLLEMDDTKLFSRLDVASQELKIALAEYRRAEQSSVRDREAASRLPMLKASVERNEAEVSYVNGLLKRTHIYSEIEGLAILPNAFELEGKPVRIGEKILTIARPDKADLEFWLMVGDSIPLPKDAEVVLFLNVKPDEPVAAKLEYVNYQAELSPEGPLAFRAKASFIDQSKLPRIGWRGTAKLYGNDVSLSFYIFRRPYAAARQWLGM